MTDPLLTALRLPDGLVRAVVGLLRERGETVATAESLTAGLVAAALTCVPGSSAVVRGGLVVYATELKAALTGVPDALLAEHGAVHPAVAAELARGARDRCGATWGIGLTGVAGPDPQDGVSPGRVYVGVAGTGQPAVHTVVRTVVHTVDAPGDRHAVRAAAVRTALDAVRAALIG